MKNKLLSIFITLALMFTASNVAYAKEVDSVSETESTQAEETCESAESDSTSANNASDISTTTPSKTDDSQVVDDSDEANDSTSENENNTENVLQDDEASDEEKDSQDEEETDEDEENDDETDDENLDELEEDDNPCVELSLTDSKTGITVNGTMPKDSILTVAIMDPYTDLLNQVIDYNMQMNYDMDTFDFMFIENTYSITITDADGECFTPEDLTIKKALDFDTVNRLGDNPTYVYANGDKISSSYSQDDESISFSSDTTSCLFSIVGFETYKFCTVTFEILSKSDDSFISSSQCRYRIGDEIIIPEFYSKDLKKLKNFTWNNVDEVAKGDATYVHYIDSSEYVVDKEN